MLNVCLTKEEWVTLTIFLNEKIDDAYDDGDSSAIELVSDVIEPLLHKICIQVYDENGE